MNNTGNEKWESIYGYSEYSVSNKGNIRSFKVKTFPKILKQSVGTTGYYKVSLWKDNKAKTQKVHRLVASAFIPNLNNKKCINHKDGNKLNNLVGNLEWCTYSENNIHALKMGLRSLYKTHQSCKRSVSIRTVKGNIIIKESVKSMAEYTGLNVRTISRWLNQETEIRQLGYKSIWFTENNENSSLISQPAPEAENQGEVI